MKILQKGLVEYQPTFEAMKAFNANRDEVLASLKRFECWTAEFREILTLGQDDRLERLLQRANWMKKNRDALGD